jgi:hypothetical protein
VCSQRYLDDSGYNNLQVGIAFSSFGIGALVGYAACLLYQVCIGDTYVTSSRKWVCVMHPSYTTCVYVYPLRLSVCASIKLLVYYVARFIDVYVISTNINSDNRFGVNI